MLCFGFDIRHSLFVFAVQLMLAAATAELLELKPVGRVLFVLGRHVIALFAFRALQNDVISRHLYNSLFQTPHSLWDAGSGIHTAIPRSP